MTSADASEPRTMVMHRSAPRAIEWAAERITEGGVIALPTDTVYAIAAALSHPEALDRIFLIKRRPDDQVLPVLVSSSGALERLGVGDDPRISLLLNRFWPGPLTVVVPAVPGLPARVVAPDGTVGVRLPNHPLAIEVIEKAGGAIAATSANHSGAPPARTAEEVAIVLGPCLDLILDGGKTPGGVVSTVVRFRADQIHVLREGAISADVIAAEWAAVGLR